MTTRMVVVRLTELEARRILDLTHTRSPFSQEGTAAVNRARKKLAAAIRAIEKKR